MSDVNIPLLRKAVEWAEAEAAKPIELCEWNQLDWVATPQMQARSRELLNFPGIDPMSFSLHTRTIAAKAPECGTCYCIAGYITHEIEGVPVGSDHDSWTQIAGGALGISYDVAYKLFNANNTIEDVRRIAEEIAGEAL